MTRKELKDRLHRYRELDAERRQIKEELERVEDLMTAPRSAGANDGMPHGSGVSDPTGSIVSQHLILEDRYRRQLNAMAEEQNEIEDLISPLEPTLRRLMRFRYIDGLTWEGVCVAINYSWRQTHYLHARALDKILECIG